ncbi:MAG: PilT protein-like protein [Candidatus Gottesmanbacteria bacterium GW2011_GWC2_39_8]|uniref:PilT protein-like protein n=1 Tax=Candidatus Gottesmanbacteria bacterium GW2011_GWC2_39_8 TaxID=1618450 RepID=A0A0G0PWV5_9BACT|nr:MAG: PilT protein-like protein [Candidatus Gottesmanbacteria bacterium GW2011_GWC2_39_8]
MGKVIALDSMVFIYLFEDDRRYINKIFPLFKDAEKGKLTLVTSIISVIEALSTPKYISDENTRMEITNFFRETDGLSVKSIDWEIAETAAGLRRENRTLRVPDSLQLSTALICRASSLITNDLNITKISIPKLNIKTLN